MANLVKRASLDGLWTSVSPGKRVFRPGQLPGLPDAAWHYLRHAIAPGAPLTSAVRLRMHGEIKLRRWLPFIAEQVIHWGHGIWNATARMNGMLIRGFDRLVNGEGAMRWKLLGMIPVMTPGPVLDAVRIALKGSGGGSDAVGVGGAREADLPGEFAGVKEVG